MCENYWCFFFQAEDGIRDLYVTGVQTCALPILLDDVDLLLIMTVNPGFGGQSYLPSSDRKIQRARAMLTSHGRDVFLEVDGRSEERRVGKECRSGWSA